MQAWTAPELLSLQSGTEQGGKIPIGLEFIIFGELSDEDQPDGDS